MIWKAAGDGCLFLFTTNKLNIHRFVEDNQYNFYFTYNIIHNVCIFLFEKRINEMAIARFMERQTIFMEGDVQHEIIESEERGEGGEQA
jgi:hypothetical protein